MTKFLSGGLIEKMARSLAEVSPARNEFLRENGPSFVSPLIKEGGEIGIIAQEAFLRPFTDIADDCPKKIGTDVEQLGRDCLFINSEKGRLPQETLRRVGEEIQELSDKLLMESSDPRVRAVAEIAPSLAGLTQEPQESVV